MLLIIFITYPSVILCNLDSVLLPYKVLHIIYFLPLAADISLSMIHTYLYLIPKRGIIGMNDDRLSNCMENE